MALKDTVQNMVALQGGTMHKRDELLIIIQLTAKGEWRTNVAVDYKNSAKGYKEHSMYCTQRSFVMM